MSDEERFVEGWRVVGIYYRRFIGLGLTHVYNSPNEAKEHGYGPYTKIIVWSRKVKR